MLDVVNVAAVAAETVPENLSQNLDVVSKWTKQAAQSGSQLVLFQELSLTGFVPNHPEGNHEAWLREALQIARRSAVTVPGPVIGQLTDIAKQHDVWLSVGLLEDAGNTLYNTQVLVGPKGLCGKWRKMHIPMFETPFYNGGEAPSVVQTELGRIGCNICFDSLLPESTRLLAVQNVEIVLFPYAADPAPRTPAGWEAWARTALAARCAENGVFGVACNYVGEVECAGVKQNFPGGGMVVGPRGETLASWPHPGDTPGMLQAELKADDLLQARAEPEYLFRFRRPELYRSLCD